MPEVRTISPMWLAGGALALVIAIGMWTSRPDKPDEPGAAADSVAAAQAQVAAATQPARATSNRTLPGDPSTPDPGPTLETLHSSLDGITSAQEAVYNENKRFTNDMTKLKYVLKKDVEVQITEATAEGWAAIASTPGIIGVCVTAMGKVARIPTTKSGQTPPVQGGTVCDTQ